MIKNNGLHSLIIAPRYGKITNLFTNTNKGIAFRTTTTLQQLTKPIPTDQIIEYEKNEFMNSHAKQAIVHI
jgi:hypothetical protein